MRKLTLTLCMAAATSMAIGQNVAVKTTKAQQRLSKADDVVAPAPEKKTTRDGVEIIYLETFDASNWRNAINDEYLAVPANMPAGWEVYDNTGNNYFWHWTDRGPRGAYTSNPNQFNDNQFLQSESNTNNPDEKGCMAMEIDFHNTNPEWAQVANAVDGDTYLQTPAIDCSGAVAVGIKFAQRHRLCCGNYDAVTGPIMLVSNNGTDFSYSLNVNQASVNATPVTNPSIFDVSITPVAAGQSTVYIRFHLMGESAYYWMIDDITLYIPADYDARIKYHWADFGSEAIAYNNHQYIEKLFIGAPFQVAKYALQEFVTSRTHSSSVGKYTLENMRMKTTFSSVAADGTTTELSAAESEGISLPTGMNDTTLTITHNYTVPAEIGKYEIKGEIISDNEDGVPEDNTITNYFNVTENTLGYANPDHATSERQSPFSYVGAVDGDGIGIIVPLNPSSTGLYDLQGVNVYISRDSYNWRIWDQGAVAYLQAQLCACLDPEALDFDIPNPIVSTESIPIDSTCAGAWVFLPFNRDGAAEYLTVTEPNTYYYLNLRFTTNGMGDGGRFYVGADNITQASWFANWITVGGDDEEGYATQTSSIAMELVANEFGAQWPTSNLAVSLKNINPQTGVEEHAYGASLKLFIPNGEGGVTTEEHVYNGTAIQFPNLKNGAYGYRASWTCIVEGVADSTIYRNGAIAVQGGNVHYTVNFDRNSIEDAPVAVPALGVYPNPASNMITVTTQNAARIVITNLVGQTMNVIGTPAERHVVSLAGYEAGVYMVTVYDHQGNANTQRVVKN